MYVLPLQGCSGNFHLTSLQSKKNCFWPVTGLGTTHHLNILLIVAPRRKGTSKKVQATGATGAAQQTPSSYATCHIPSEAGGCNHTRPQHHGACEEYEDIPRLPLPTLRRTAEHLASRSSRRAIPTATISQPRPRCFQGGRPRYRQTGWKGRRRG